MSPTTAQVEELKTESRFDKKLSRAILLAELRGRLAPRIEEEIENNIATTVNPKWCRWLCSRRDGIPKYIVSSKIVRVKHRYKSTPQLKTLLREFLQEFFDMIGREASRKERREVTNRATRVIEELVRRNEELAAMLSAALATDRNVS